MRDLATIQAQEAHRARLNYQWTQARFLAQVLSPEALIARHPEVVEAVYTLLTNVQDLEIRNG